MSRRGSQSGQPAARCGEVVLMRDNLARCSTASACGIEFASTNAVDDGDFVGVLVRGEQTGDDGSMWIAWVLIGFGLGLAAAIPLIRAFARRAELRARQAERRARDAERLAELGSMTGGLAHEIKNPLSTVGLNAQLLAEGISDSDLPEDEKQRLLKRLDGLAREVERLKGILTDFLQFAGRMQLHREPHDLVQLVDSLADFFHPQCDQARVVLRTDLPSEPVVASIDAGLVKQAVLNLMLNGLQAMAASSASASAKSDGPTELILTVRREGDEALITVVDTGPGFDPAKIDEMFRPYVSGRPGGTGLGLPTSSRIIEEHGGVLNAQSAAGHGSEFQIRLPVESG